MSRATLQKQLIYSCTLIFLLPILSIGCKKPEILKPIDNPILPSRGFYMGILPTTAEGQSFEDAYFQAGEYSEFVPVWGRPTPFYNLADDLKGDWGKTFVQQLIRGNGMFPLIHLSFIGPGLSLIASPEIDNPSLSDSRWRAEYKKSILDVIRAIKPLYLSIGNEVNRWYEKYGLEGDNGFKHFISLYEEIYDEAKNLSPDINIFCTFARELVSENREADMEVLRLFNSDKMDLLIITSYPYSLGITHPSKIPDDYYSRCADYMPEKPFGFSEVAWSSLEALGGEQAQADFLIQLTSRLTKERGIQLFMVGWPWLHDLDKRDTIGLIRIDGSEKLAYTTWRSISEQ